MIELLFELGHEKISKISAPKYPFALKVLSKKLGIPTALINKI